MDMREKIARAAWERNRETCASAGVDLDPWEDETEALREDWLLVIDAVLEAMREPTKEMLTAGVNGAGGVGSGLEPVDADNLRDAWRAMIDAARTKEPTP